ncbi:hypothetical protein CHE29_12600 [Salmonella enterica]|nr:hypothetical protein CHE29_12600 [Salmonella enterica]
MDICLHHISRKWRFSRWVAQIIRFKNTDIQVAHQVTNKTVFDIIPDIIKKNKLTTAPEECINIMEMTLTINIINSAISKKKNS